MKSDLERIWKNSVWLLLLIVICVAYYLARDAYFIGFFNDDAHYILGAKSLLHGRYVELFNPDKIPLINYFPGYPIILAVWMLFFSSTEISLRIISCLISISVLLAAYIYFKNKLKTANLMYFIALLGFNSLNLSLAGAVLSDMSFALFVLLSMYAYDKSNQMNSNAYAALTGFLCGFLFLIRPLGAVFIVVLILDLALKKDWKKLFVFVSIAGLISLIWVVRNLIVRGISMTFLFEFFNTQKSSGFSFNQKVLNIFGHFLKYLYDMFSYTIFRPPTMINHFVFRLLITISLSALFAAGLIKSLKNIIVYAFLLYMAVIIAWPVYATRYLLPVIPIFLFFLFKGMELVFSRIPKVSHVIGMAGILLCIQPGFQIIQASVLKNNIKSKPPLGVFDWIRNNTSEDAVFLAANEAVIYLKTGRHAKTMHRYKDSEELTAEMKNGKVNYIVASQSDLFLKSDSNVAMRDPLKKEELEKLIMTSGKFKSVFQSSDQSTVIYELAQ